MHLRILGWHVKYQNKIGEMFITSLDTRAKHGLDCRLFTFRLKCIFNPLSFKKLRFMHITYILLARPINEIY